MPFPDIDSADLHQSIDTGEDFMVNRQHGNGQSRGRSRTDSYNTRNEQAIKIRKIDNGYLVSPIGGAPSAYPHLGDIQSPPDGNPTSVGEHIWAFFNGE